ncbi:MAG: hypothetical protein AAB116_09810 [Candidatus Poribacteria bacterium]
MTSEKQTKANQRNALKSTGPKTEEGKTVASLNALKHGLRSQELALLPTEDEEAFHSLKESLMADKKPEGGLENILVEQIIGATWRLRRIQNIETGIIGGQYYKIQAEQSSREASSYTYPGDYDRNITNRRRYEEALKREKEATEMAKSEIPTLGEAFSKAQDSLAKLSRYQSEIERSLYKALAELEKLQSKRKSPGMTMVIDVQGKLE